MNEEFCYNIYYKTFFKYEHNEEKSGIVFISMINEDKDLNLIFRDNKGKTKIIERFNNIFKINFNEKGNYYLEFKQSNENKENINMINDIKISTSSIDVINEKINLNKNIFFISNNIEFCSESPLEKIAYKIERLNENVTLFFKREYLENYECSKIFEVCNEEKDICTMVNENTYFLEEGYSYIIYIHYSTCMNFDIDIQYCYLPYIFFPILNETLTKVNDGYY